MSKPELKPNRKSTFIKEEDGSSAVESMIMIPLVFFVLLSIFTLFDAFRQYAMHQKAAYTISDMISRETLPLDSTYLEWAHALFDTMTRAPQDSSLRVSIVRYDSRDNIIKLDWSKTRGNTTALSNNQVRNWTAKLPVMVHNERMIVVETFANYVAPFTTGLEDREIANFIFTRPRYAPQVLWQGI